MVNTITIYYLPIYSGVYQVEAYEASKNKERKVKKMNEERILEKEKFTPEFIIEQVSEVIMEADKIHAVLMCFVVEKHGKVDTLASAIGKPFDLLNLATHGVPDVAEKVGIKCVKKLMGKYEGKKDEE